MSNRQKGTQDSASRSNTATAGAQPVQGQSESGKSGAPAA